MQQTKKIQIFTIIYTVISILSLALLAMLLLALCMLGESIEPLQITNYGNDTVSGWATIFSIFGAVGSIFGAMMFFLLVFLCVVMTIYWAIGLAMSCVLRKRIKKNLSLKGLGIALGVWTIIPGAISLLNLLRNCIGGKMGLGSGIVQFVVAALFVGGGTFLLTTVCRKNAN